MECVAKAGIWNDADDEALKKAVEKHGIANWKDVGNELSKTDAQCFHRYEAVIQPSISRGHWTKNEDSVLKHIVRQVGEQKWTLIASYIPGRTGKQCRERWVNHLHPELRKDPWTKAEDDVLIRLHGKIGNQWRSLCKYIPGRSENSIKNRWNTFHRRGKRITLPPLRASLKLNRTRSSCNVAAQAP